MPVECFNSDIEIQKQENNLYMQNVGNIGEELWVYSKIRELLCGEEDKKYCENELKKVTDKINFMEKEVKEHLNLNVANQVKQLCDLVYAGMRFDDTNFNEFIQKILNNNRY